MSFALHRTMGCIAGCMTFCPGHGHHRQLVFFSQGYLDTRSTSASTLYIDIYCLHFRTLNWTARSSLFDTLGISLAFPHFWERTHRPYWYIVRSSIHLESGLAVFPISISSTVASTSMSIRRSTSNPSSIPLDGRSAMLAADGTLSYQTTDRRDCSHSKIP